MTQTNSINLYQIVDHKGETCISIIYRAYKDALAVRIFTELLNDTTNRDNEIAKYPADYALWHLGTQDMNTGQLEAIPRTVVYTGQQWLDEKRREEARAVAPTTDARLNGLQTPTPQAIHPIVGTIVPEHKHEWVFQGITPDTGHAILDCRECNQRKHININ